jgi:hypothetical protein
MKLCLREKIALRFLLAEVSSGNIGTPNLATGAHNDFIDEVFICADLFLNKCSGNSKIKYDNQPNSLEKAKEEVLEDLL